MLREFRKLGAALLLVSVLLCTLSLAAQDAAHLPQISHPVSSGGFVSAVGPRAALLGNENGRFEAWVYPLKIVRDLHVRFHIDNRVVEGAAVARNVIIRPESSTIVYSAGAFQVRETLFIPIHEPGASQRAFKEKGTGRSGPFLFLFFSFATGARAALRFG